jgi:hypothetical protein
VISWVDANERSGSLKAGGRPASRICFLAGAAGVIAIALMELLSERAALSCS